MFLISTRYEQIPRKRNNNSTTRNKNQNNSFKLHTLLKMQDHKVKYNLVISHFSVTYLSHHAQEYGAIHIKDGHFN